MHLWQKHDYAWWRGDRGDRRGNIQGFYLDNRNSRSQNIYLRFGWRPAGRPGCLVIFPGICQIIILMNYEAVIGSKAASTEWFPTLSKWSLWRSREELLIAGAGIWNSLSQWFCKYSNILLLIHRNYFLLQTQHNSGFWRTEIWKRYQEICWLLAYNNVCDSLKMNIYQAKSFLLCPEMWRDICTPTGER